MKGWGGPVFAEALLNTQDAEQDFSARGGITRAITALGAVAGGIIGTPLTLRHQAIAAAKDVEPYTITFHHRPSVKA